MNVTQLAAAFQSGGTAQVLDVRTPSEFENAHISGAYNVPLDQLHEHAREIRAATGTVILVCQSGQRARQADTLLRQSGMTSVHVLEGGMNAWLAAGQPVRRVRARVSIERQVRMIAGGVVAAASVAALLVSPLFAVIPALIGSGLLFAGATDTCAMGFALAKLPYNRASVSCDTEAIVRQFLDEDSPS